ncbi:MAG: adenine deaminase [Bacteroidota bacterium]
MKNIINANIVDITNKTIYWGELIHENGVILSVQKRSEEKESEPYVIPGFIDSHVHIESSMLVPSEFAKMAVVHGTIGTVSDPHEIANVCGMEGVRFMIENGKKVPFYFCFGAPSCVPATVFETAGSILDCDDVAKLLNMPEIGYLSEVMNFPGVLNGDPEMMEKIAAAKSRSKPVDGHAPGLRGEQAKKYIEAGIQTDHECYTAEEASDKLKYGMKILIREGSAAKNFEALIDLLHDHEDEMMFCSDDMHPNSLEKGHINLLCERAVKKGVDVFKVLKAACINPAKHYGFKSGLLREGDVADFILVDSLKRFHVLQTIIRGVVVAEKGKSYIQSDSFKKINRFECEIKNPDAFEISFSGQEKILVIKALDGQLITDKWITDPKIESGKIVQDQERDVLKISVVNRYKNATVASAFITGFGIKDGAIASSVAHDSHNIVVVGSSDEWMSKAVNEIIKQAGGVSAVHENETRILALPVAGLMSDGDGYEVAAAYSEIDRFAKVNLKSGLSAPFMTLSFMALLVIPSLKLSDLGLFDGEEFRLISI